MRLIIQLSSDPRCGFRQTSSAIVVDLWKSGTTFPGTPSVLLLSGSGRCKRSAAEATPFD
ncbi:MAG: hypothetical protein V2J65_26185 [Desulfobacteraceae bacterium]|nr:hypothetical protein [Desulfobacteraceae bacterium]